MTEIILACDPGITGAFSVFENGQLIEIIDMPIFEVKSGQTMKKRINAAEVAAFFKKYQHAKRLIIEQVGGMPGQSGSASFTFGYGAGILEGAAAALGIPISFTPPQRWRPGIGLGASDKGASRQMATRLYPSFSSFFAKAKNDGRAEAVLIGAWYLKVNA
jgi:hypothetical protein